MEVTIDLNPSQNYDVQLLHVVVELKEMLINVKSSIHDYGDEKLKHEFEVMKGCVTLFTKPFTFLRPTPIALPSKGSIYSLQNNVQRIGCDMGNHQKIESLWKLFTP